MIDERDVFMARALAAAATGKAAVAPALAADTGVDGAPLWRYVMGTDGPTGEFSGGLRSAWRGLGACMAH